LFNPAHTVRRVDAHEATCLCAVNMARKAGFPKACEDTQETSFRRVKRDV